MKWRKRKIVLMAGIVFIYRAAVRRLCGALNAHWRTRPAVEKSTNEVDEFSSNFQNRAKSAAPHVRRAVACAIATPPSSTKETRTPWKLRSWSLQACRCTKRFSMFRLFTPLCYLENGQDRTPIKDIDARRLFHKTKKKRKK